MRSGFIYLNALVNGTVLKDSVYLQILKPTLTTGTLTTGAICAGSPLRLPLLSNTGSQGITWVYDGKIDILGDGSAVIYPNVSGNANVTQQLGSCRNSLSLPFAVKPTRVQITNMGDTLEICLGSRVTLNASTNTGSTSAIRWIPDDKSLDSPRGVSVKAQPMVSTTYTALFESDGCLVKDSIHIRVDSLPASLRIERDENKAVYCQGTIVKMVSPVYDPSRYPDIRHKWFPYRGFESPDSLYNLVVTTIDSIILFRATSNHACRDTQPVILNVIKPKDLKLLPRDTTVCAGEKVTLNLSFSGPGEISWEPEDAVSCKSCRNPNLFLTTSREIKATVKEKDCPSTITAKINVISAPSLNFNTKTTLCRGEEVQLLLNTNPLVSYSWKSSADPNFTSTSANLRVRPTENTTYTVTARQGSCAATTASVAIRVIQVSNLTLPANLTLCPGTALNLEATGNAAAGVDQQFKWTFNNQTVLGPRLSLPNLAATTTFVVDYTFGPNCGGERKSVTVTVPVLPRLLGFRTEPDGSIGGVPLGEKITLTANLNPPALPGLTYQWKANGKDIPGSTAILEHTPTENPTTYTLTIGTAGGCSVSFTSPPIPVLAPVFDIPNAFTPDGDSANDFFNIVFRGKIEIATFRIFNRWGQLVYNNDTPSTGWDGRFQGANSPSDVYIYYIVIRFPDGKEFVRKGDLTLFR